MRTQAISPSSTSRSGSRKWLRQFIRRGGLRRIVQRIGQGSRRLATHWNLGVSKVVRRIVFDLRYYESTYDYPGLLGDPTSQYVLSVSYALRGAKPRI